MCAVSPPRRCLPNRGRSAHRRPLIHRARAPDGTGFLRSTGLDFFWRRKKATTGLEIWRPAKKKSSPVPAREIKNPVPSRPGRAAKKKSDQAAPAGPRDGTGFFFRGPGWDWIFFRRPPRRDWDFRQASETGLEFSPYHHHSRIASRPEHEKSSPVRAEHEKSSPVPSRTRKIQSRPREKAK